MASAFGFWPYRCDDCSHRFWRFARNPVLAQQPERTAAGAAMARQPEPPRPRSPRVPTPPSSAMA